MLDQLGERYGMLPHKVLQEANTLDLIVFDVSATYRNNQIRKAQGKSQDFNKMYSTEELQERLNRAREK